MLQVGGDLDLGQKAFDAEHGAELGFEHLERDRAVVPHVAREVHGRHAAAADLPLDRVAISQRCTQLRKSVHDPGVVMDLKVAVRVHDWCAVRRHAASVRMGGRAAASPRRPPPGRHSAAAGRCASASARCATCRRSCKLVWRTSPALTVANLLLRLVRALLPVATLYVGKLIIDEVVAPGAAPAGAPDGLREWLAQRPARPPRLAAGRRVRAGRALRRARPRRLAARLAALRAVHQRHQRAPDGARGHARPRGLRGQRAAGPARPRAPPDHGPHDADEPALRPGAGRGHHRQLRRRAGGLRALADRAAARGARAGLPRRGALQRAELLAQLRADAGAARARLRAPDRAPASRPRRK